MDKFLGNGERKEEGSKALIDGLTGMHYILMSEGFLDWLELIGIGIETCQILCAILHTIRRTIWMQAR
jgi:hypothetical protein